jgi:O-antigen ligase
MQSKRRRDRILYGLAVCLLLAASTSTFRKTAFLAPIAVLLTIGFFRRRELLRLAPLGVVALVMVHVLSPGAMGGILGQLGGSRLSGAATVDDRASDYDAIRPDVWTHLLIGRGYGSYEQTRFRILDSEILHRLVEVGVVGLAAYLAMAVSVVFTLRRTIRARDPVLAPPALIAAAACAVFLTVSTLFDVLSFPHTPYLFLVFAGLAAVLVQRPEAAP